jgi:hypothetical protein
MDNVNPLANDNPGLGVLAQLIDGCDKSGMRDRHRAER